MIKFRAWQKVHKKMYEVYSVDFRHGLAYCHNKEKNTDHTFGMIDVVLMQYVEKTDVNGKDIYERDIFSWGVYSSGRHTEVVKPIRETGSQFSRAEAYYNKPEIIGNIYEKGKLCIK